jgi:hypothetical protein
MMTQPFKIQTGSGSVTLLKKLTTGKVNKVFITHPTMEGVKFYENSIEIQKLFSLNLQKILFSLQLQQTNF